MCHECAIVEGAGFRVVVVEQLPFPERDDVRAREQGEEVWIDMMSMLSGGIGWSVISTGKARKKSGCSDVLVGDM